MNRLFENTPDEIRQLSDRCVTHVKNRLGFELDHSIETISVLDLFLEELVKEESRGMTPAAGDPIRSHVVPLMAPTVGAYFGVVLALAFGARWRNTDRDPRYWRLEFEQFCLRFNPVGAAANAIAREILPAYEGTMVTNPALSPHLAERLHVAPPLPEDDFFSLAAVVDVIQIAEDYLKERARKDGPVDCSAAGYDLIFGLQK